MLQCLRRRDSGIYQCVTRPAELAIRLATRADLPAIADIYNHEVSHSTSTFDTEPVTLENRRVWLESHNSARHPAVVAALGSRSASLSDHRANRGGRTIAGFGSLSPWSQRPAYARTAEVSVYVHRDARGRGVGRNLVVDLMARARAAGLRVLLARICAESRPSVALHESLGFRHIGTMRRVGEKFGRILDIEFYDLQLDRGADQSDGDQVPGDRSIAQ
ncbi:MAG: N-acetyltransferase family protein [Proteobacteria bacterium]|nr:N-acetyltransferase family protein [Pseudomonadota bacterium]